MSIKLKNIQDRIDLLYNNPIYNHPIDTTLNISAREVDEQTSKECFTDISPPVTRHDLQKSFLKQAFEIQRLHISLEEIASNTKTYLDSLQHVPGQSLKKSLLSTPQLKTRVTWLKRADRLVNVLGIALGVSTLLFGTILLSFLWKAFEYISTFKHSFRAVFAFVFLNKITLITAALLLGLGLLTFVIWTFCRHYNFLILEKRTRGENFQEFLKQFQISDNQKMDLEVHEIYKDYKAEIVNIYNTHFVNPEGQKRYYDYFEKKLQ